MKYYLSTAWNHVNKIDSEKFNKFKKWRYLKSKDNIFREGIFNKTNSILISQKIKKRLGNLKKQENVLPLYWHKKTLRTNQIFQKSQKVSKSILWIKKKSLKLHKFMASAKFQVWKKLTQIWAKSEFVI